MSAITCACGKGHSAEEYDARCFKRHKREKYWPWSSFEYLSFERNGSHALEIMSQNQ